MSQETTHQTSTAPLLHEIPNTQSSKAQIRPVNKDEEKIAYPKGAFFIIINQFCERFNYNGMKAILPLFMRNILKFDENLATVIYHSMTIVCYIFPILGAVIGDAYLGNFKTVLYFSILYAVGSIILPIAAIPYFLPQAVVLSMIALLIINIGSGGIRPCITAFGGDQFTCPQQLPALETFFSVIYLAINAATLIAVFVTPILREDVECFGEDTCFALGFGVPAAVMLVALVAFVMGKPFYTKKSPDRSIISDFFACIWRGIRRKFTVKYVKHDHWLDYASDKYDRQLIEDIKQVLSVTVVFIPLPVFWALYDQQGSRWTFQATRMNGDLGGWVVKPEQMQILNPVIVMLLIPLFDHVIYPIFKKCGLLTPLQRIGSGLVLCAASFIVSAFVEISLEPTYARIPSEGLMQLNFINALPCNVDLHYAIGTNSSSVQINSMNFVTVENLEAGETITILEAIAKGENCSLSGNHLANVDLGRGYEKSSYSVLIIPRNHEMTIFRMNNEEQIEKSVSGDPFVGFYNVLNGDFHEGAISMKQGHKEVKYFYNETGDATPISADYVVATDFQEVEIRDHEVYISEVDESIGKIENLMQGGVYRVVILPPTNETSVHSVMTVQLTSPNTVSILWLLPQIFVVSIAEILFAVTLITFSFTEAPERMKSVMQAISLLIIAVGNFIVIVVAETQSGLSQKNEFFLFAGIMGIATIVFALIAVRYNYVTNESDVKEKP